MPITGHTFYLTGLNVLLVSGAFMHFVTAIEKAWPKTGCFVQGVHTEGKGYDNEVDAAALFQYLNDGGTNGVWDWAEAYRPKLPTADDHLPMTHCSSAELFQAKNINQILIHLTGDHGFPLVRNALVERYCFLSILGVAYNTGWTKPCMIYFECNTGTLPLTYTTNNCE